MAKKLTAGVLQGTSYKETMELEWDGEALELEIRALSNKESTEVEALMQEGVDIKGKPGKGGKMERQVDFDTKKNLFGRNKSDIKAVALGSTDEEITEQVVENEFPAKLIKDISQRVKQISGIGGNQDAEDLSEGES